MSEFNLNFDLPKYVETQIKTYDLEYFSKNKKSIRSAGSFNYDYKINIAYKGKEQAEQTILEYPCKKIKEEIGTNIINLALLHHYLSDKPVQLSFIVPSLSESMNYNYDLENTVVKIMAFNGKAFSNKNEESFEEVLQIVEDFISAGTQFDKNMDEQIEIFKNKKLSAGLN